VRLPGRAAYPLPHRAAAGDGEEEAGVGRRNRRQAYEPADPRPLGLRTVQGDPAGGWVVQRVGGSAKAYRCPGCDQEVPAGVPHVVAWPADALSGQGADERRHWHTPCWSARSRRRPTPRHLR
jgi:hypothetical protein